MSSKKTKLIPLLMGLPFLLMGNSPVSHTYPHYYEDYEITNLHFGDPIEGQYPLDITIKNTGDGYIAISEAFWLSTDDEGFEFEDENVMEDESFAVCLAPHSSGTYIASNLANETFTLENAYPNCYAYTDLSEATYSSLNFSFKKAVAMGELFYYELEDFDDGFNGYYHSSKIINIEVKGVPYSFVSHTSVSTVEFGLRDQTITAEDITVKSLYIAKGDSTGKQETEQFFKGLMWCGIAVLGAAVGLVLFGVFPIFILPVIIRKAKKKKES